MFENKSLTLDCKITQITGNIVSDMDGEKVMLSVKNSKYYNLGDIGGEIWDLIEKPSSISEIVKNLMSKYDVQKIECEEQVISFFNTLLGQKLIEII
jgi:hypothetical protein